MQNVLQSIRARWTSALIRFGTPDGREFSTATDLPAEGGECYVCRDSKMEQDWDEHGYHYGADGEGPFVILYEKRPLVDYALEAVSENQSDAALCRPPEPYPARLCAGWIVAITLVIASEPANNEFASHIHQLVCDACVNPE